MVRKTWIPEYSSKEYQYFCTTVAPRIVYSLENAHSKLTQRSVACKIPVATTFLYSNPHMFGTHQIRGCLRSISQGGRLRFSLGRAGGQPQLLTPPPRPMPRRMGQK